MTKKETIIILLQEETRKALNNDNVIVEKLIKEKERTAMIINANNPVAMSPVFYIDDHIENISSGMTTIADVVAEAVEFFRNNKVDNDLAVKISKEMDYEGIMKKCVLEVVNAGTNRELLEAVPHYRFLDLAFIVKVDLDHVISGARATVTNKICEKIGIEKEDLFAIARNNMMRNEGYHIMTLQEKIMEISPFPVSLPEGELPMFIITNKSGYKGANILALPKMIRAMTKDIDENIYIIPSSVHELLIVPAEQDPENISCIIKMVNAGLNEHDVLSDNLYIMNKKGDIYIA